MCKKHIFTCQEEAWADCQKRWMLSSSTIRICEHFGAPNFVRDLERLPRYIACIQHCGTRWMGLRFWFPIVWLPTKHYTLAYVVHNDWWKEFLHIDGYKVPGIEMAAKYDLAQLHADHNSSNPDLPKRQAA